MKRFRISSAPSRGAGAGVDIVTTAVGGSYTGVTGTSFATPFVTGSAAIMMQYGIVQGNDPFLYGEKIRAYLQRGAQRLTALVAFDKDRHRCGYGKGFYDRYLSRHTQHATVAMALDFQIVETVPSDVYDICPQMLITPTMIYEK